MQWVLSLQDTKLIRPIIQGGDQHQFSCDCTAVGKEVIRHKVGIKEFADEFYRVAEELDLRSPFLHIWIIRRYWM